jgi:hypothetical protein
MDDWQDLSSAYNDGAKSPTWWDEIWVWLKSLWQLPGLWHWFRRL